MGRTSWGQGLRGETGKIRTQEYGDAHVGAGKESGGKYVEKSKQKGKEARVTQNDLGRCC